MENFLFSFWISQIVLPAEPEIFPACAGSLMFLPEAEMRGIMDDIMKQEEPAKMEALPIPIL